MSLEMHNSIATAEYELPSREGVMVGFKVDGTVARPVSNSGDEEEDGGWEWGERKPDLSAAYSPARPSCASGLNLDVDGQVIPITESSQPSFDTPTGTPMWS
jgi:hypothetical protein